MKARTLIAICLISAVGAAAQTAPPSQKIANGAARKSAAAKPAAARTSKPSMKNAALKTEKAAPGKRDPFTSPVREGRDEVCASGKKCLAIGSIVLRGIVRAPSGAIAVVESSSRKVTYFLRENDPVFNGYVVKITPDSIMFRENVMDAAGRTSTRDVVKKVNAPAV